MGLILAKFQINSETIHNLKQKLSRVPTSWLIGGSVVTSTFLFTFLYCFRNLSWKQLGLAGGASWIFLILITGLLARKQPLIQITLQHYLPPNFHRYGLRLFQKIYLLTNTYHLPINHRPKLPISVVHWHDQEDHYFLFCSLTRSSQKIPKILLPPGYVVEYHIDGQKYPIPINLEIPGQVDDGEFVLFKRARKGMSFILQECDRSSFWPTPHLIELSK